MQIVNGVREEMTPGEASRLPSEVLGRKEPKLCALVPREILPVTEKFPMGTCVAVYGVISTEVFAPMEKIMLRKK